MNLSPEIKKQLEEQKKQCVFCRIANKEIESKIVFENNSAMAVLDVYPALKGHTIFFPKEHYPIMPALPPEEFKNLFGLVPELSKAIKDAALSTGINLFIANGGVAGQKSGHFLIHLLPRENGDRFFNFLLKRKSKTPAEKINQLSTHLNKAIEKLGVADKISFSVPEIGIAESSIEVYSKTEKKDISKLSNEDAANLFTFASIASMAAFEITKAEGTNLLLKSGIADDNPDGNLCLFILPRNQKDQLESMLWEPKQADYDLEQIASKIRDKTWKLNYKKEATKTIVLENKPILLTRKILNNNAERTSREEINLAISAVREGY